MEKLTVNNAITILECSRPYTSLCCGVSDEEIDKAMLMGAEALERAQWIPISERLPEKDMYNSGAVWKRKVLITGYLSYDRKKEPFVTTVFANEVINNCDNNRGTIITAWMPLPKPYKED